MDFKEYTVKIYANGGKYWYLNDKYHREDGPAIEWANGNKYWYLDDKLHREDGPAIEYADGNKHWYLNDKNLSEKEFNKKMATKKTEFCAGKVVLIDGKKYKLTEVK